MQGSGGGKKGNNGGSLYGDNNKGYGVPAGGNVKSSIILDKNNTPGTKGGKPKK
jgi:hypothetical protein